MRSVSKKRWQRAQQHEWAYQELKSRQVAGYEQQVTAGGILHAERVRIALAPHLKMVPSTRILEVGSGPSGVCFFLEQGERYGLDPLADFFHHVFSSLQAGCGVRLIRGQGEALPFQKEAFDLVICENVLDHAMNPKAILREIHRVLRPGGVLFLGVNVGGWAFRTVSRVHERLLGRWTVIPALGPHPFHLSPKAVLRLAVSEHFRVAVAQINVHVPNFEEGGSFIGILKRKFVRYFIHSGFYQLIGLKR